MPNTFYIHDLINWDTYEHNKSLYFYNNCIRQFYFNRWNVKFIKRKKVYTWGEWETIIFCTATSSWADQSGAAVSRRRSGLARRCADGPRPRSRLTATPGAITRAHSAIEVLASVGASISTASSSPARACAAPSPTAVSFSPPFYNCTCIPTTCCGWQWEWLIKVYLCVKMWKRFKKKIGASNLAIHTYKIQLFFI